MVALPAPTTAPRRRRENLRMLSANLFALRFRPPRPRINRTAIFSKLNIENRVVRCDSPRRRRYERCLAHDGNGFTGEHELTDIDTDLIHACQEQIVSAASVDDQESAERSEGTGIGNPTIGW